VILSFADKDTQKIWQRESVKKFSPELQRAAYRKLLILDAADHILDLQIPPGNRLQVLTGKRKGQHSIRINDQWRICFTWTPIGPEFVEMVDYH
jgi:proteic killer suppression protein